MENLNLITDLKTDHRSQKKYLLRNSADSAKSKSCTDVVTLE
jgi:hypothetical protein